MKAHQARSLTVTLLLFAAVLVTAYSATSGSVQATPAITVSPTSGFAPVSGFAGTEVTIQGTGFSTAGACLITATSPGLVIDQTGEPSCTILSGTIASPFPKFKVGAGSVFSPSGYAVKVTDSGAVSATATFILDPRIFLTPTSGAPAIPVSVIGSGFTAISGPCVLTGTAVHTGPTCSQATDGTIIGNFAVDSVASGSYAVTVTDTTTSPSASTSFTVTGGPAAVFTPSVGQTGITVTVTGSGWKSGDTSVSFVKTSGPSGNLFDAPLTRNCIVSAGNIASGCTFQVSSTALGGVHTVTFTGNQGDIAIAQFQVQSSFSVSPHSGGVGTTVSLSGSGYTTAVGDCHGSLFYPSDLVTGAPTCIIAANGVLTGSLTVANTALQGLHTITLANVYVAQGSVSDTFNVVTSVTLNPTSGAPGSLVSVSGSGFTHTSALCHITGTPVHSGPTCTQAADGTLIGQFTVDSVATGTYFVVVADTLGNPIVSVPFTITGGPTVIFSPFQGPTGTSITVTGSGWNSLDSSVTLTKSSGPPGSGNLWNLPNPTCAVSGGNIAGCTFTVQSNAIGGTYTLVATGTQGDSSNVQFTVQSSFVLTPSGGPMSTIISLSGSGYAGSVPDCHAALSFNPNEPFFTGTPTCVIGSNGVLTGSITVASSGVNSVPHTITLTDANVVPGPSISAVFIVTSNLGGASISLNPVSAPPGFGLVRVAGSGFAPSAVNTLTLCYLSSPGGPFTLSSSPPSLCDVNSSGNLIGNFTVSTNAIPGTYVIQALETASIYAQAAFTVTSGVVTTTATTGIVTTTGIATFTGTTGFGTFTGTQFITVSVNPTSTGPGFFVTVSGSGFNPTDNLCLITVQTPTPFSGTCSFTNPNSGTITGSFTVPTPGPPPGTYEVIVEGNGGDSGFTSIVIAAGATSTSIFTSYTSTSTFTTTTSTTSTTTGFSTSFSTTTVSSTGVSSVVYTVYSQTTQTGPTTTSITNSPTTTYLVNRTTTGGTTYLTITIPSTVTVTGFITGVVAQTSNASAPDYVGVMGLLLLLGWSLVRRVWA